MVENAFQVAVEANAIAYRRAAQTSAPGDCWDFVILTAANEKQAQGYRQELALRHRSVGPAGSFFPAIQKSLVVPDPPGRRAGSGGATLGVLKALCEQYHLSGDDLKQQRILLIHSGGASQRLPAYSPLGKIFAPLPLLRPDGQISTLFDHLYVTLAGLPERLGPGMLILAGDVFLLFDHRHVQAPPTGVTALTMRVEAELGRGHGVFATDGQQRILQTLQKAPIETMKSAGAVDAQGQVLIDTGLLFFDPERTAVLASLAGAGRKTGKGLHERFAQQIDLYDEMTAALAVSTDRTQFLAAPGTAPLRKELWKSLHGVPFQTLQLEGQFLHLGTTRQFRDAMVGHNPSPAAELFQQNILVHSRMPLPEDCRVYHSAFLEETPDFAHESSRIHTNRSGVREDSWRFVGNTDPVSIGPGSVIEHSILAPGSKIGRGCVVSQFYANGNPLVLSDNLLFFQVPVRFSDGRLLYVHVLCGVEDDFKGKLASGECRFMNQPIQTWLKRHRLAAEDVWGGIPAEARTLWNARLFSATPDWSSIESVLWFQSPTPTAPAVRSKWKRGPRYSMAMVLEQTDPVALIEQREIVAVFLQTGALLDSIQRGEDRPLDSFLSHYTTPGAYGVGVEQLARSSAAFSAAPQGLLNHARALWCISQLLQRPDRPEAYRGQSDAFAAQAFAKIAEASEPALVAPPAAATVASAPPRLAPGLRIEATAPVRLDLAGGWSDTPPYCYERGGRVVNIAINLNDQPPVRAMVRTIHEPLLILESHDLGTHVELKTLESLQQERGVHDPFALHKVALDMVGLVPRPGAKRGDIQSHLRKLGAGLIVSTECRVPKGSGLGTSSILAATLLGALQELLRNQQFPTF